MEIVLTIGAIARMGREKLLRNNMMMTGIKIIQRVIKKRKKK